MRILERDALAAAVVRLVGEARARLVLVCAGFAPWQALASALEAAKERHVDTTLVLVGGDSHTAGDDRARALADAGVKMVFFGPLIARYYLSEREAIFTTLDLTSVSAANGLEAGVWLGADEDRDAFTELRAIVDRLVARAAEESAANGDGAPARRGVRLWAVAPEGYCIRCRASVPANPDRPLCRDCYESWAEHHNSDFPEKFCLACGGAERASMRRPLCPQCYGRLYA